MTDHAHRSQDDDGSRGGDRQRNTGASRPGQDSHGYKKPRVQATRRHSQRGGADRESTKFGPSRKGFRDERQRTREAEPDLPEGIDISDLDPMILQDLKVLSKDNADSVAKHMITAVDLLTDEPQLALRHARAAKNRAGRVGVAREVNGIVAYRAGEWKEALSELRASRRISGGPGLLAVMADCERGLGRPEKALELGRSEQARQLDQESKVELAIVVSGARLDLNQPESAVATLERMSPSMDDTSECGGRLSYAYAEALLAAGRKAEAKEWFHHAAEVDVNDMTDARERYEAL